MRRKLVWLLLGSLYGARSALAFITIYGKYNYRFCVSSDDALLKMRISEGNTTDYLPLLQESFLAYDLEIFSLVNLLCSTLWDKAAGPNWWQFSSGIRELRIEDRCAPRIVPPDMYFVEELLPSGEINSEEVYLGLSVVGTSEELEAASKTIKSVRRGFSDFHAFFDRAAHNRTKIAAKSLTQRSAELVDCKAENSKLVDQKKHLEQEHDQLKYSNDYLHRELAQKNHHRITPPILSKFHSPIIEFLGFANALFAGTNFIRLIVWLVGGNRFARVAVAHNQRTHIEPFKEDMHARYEALQARITALGRYSTENLKKAMEEVEKNFSCSITGKILSTPMQTSTGQVYDFEGLKEWFDSSVRRGENPTAIIDPKTHTLINMDYELSRQPNYHIRQLIDSALIVIEEQVKVQEELSNTNVKLSSSSKHCNLIPCS